jgi:hypothetical protein
MQCMRTLQSERFTAPLVIMSLVAGVVLTVTLASMPVAQMPVSPDQWRMWCWAGFGAWFGLTFQFLRTPAVRFIPLPVAGLLAFAVAQIVTVTAFDSTVIALPYALAPILPVAIFGGIALALFGRFVKEHTSIWSFLLIGCLSFGIGQSLDFGIRNALLLPNIDQLNAFMITNLKLIATACFGLCIGIGSFIAVKRRSL